MDYTDETMMAMLRMERRKEDLARLAWHTLYVYSSAIANIVKDDSMMCKDNVPKNCSTEMGGDKVLKTKRIGTSKELLTGRRRTIKLDRILHVPKIAHNLVSDSGLCYKWSHRVVRQELRSYQVGEKRRWCEQA